MVEYTSLRGGGRVKSSSRWPLTQPARGGHLITNSGKYTLRVPGFGVVLFFKPLIHPATPPDP